MILNVQGGERDRLDLRLSPLPKPSDEAVTSGAVPPARPVAAAAPPTATDAAPVPIRSDGPPRWIAYGLFGGAAVALGIAGWQWTVREDEVDEWNDDACLADEQDRRSNCGEHEDNYEQAQLAAGISLASGAALAVTGVILLLAGTERAADTERAECRPGFADLGLTCGLRF